MRWGCLYVNGAELERAARAALAASATELDVIINRGLVASGREDKTVAEAAEALPGAMVKVIPETPQRCAS